jgi:hypothetical protein
LHGKRQLTSSALSSSVRRPACRKVLPMNTGF